MKMTTSMRFMDDVCGGGLAIAYFNSPGCRGCLLFKRDSDTIDKLLPHRIYSCDILHNEEIANKLDVGSFPTFIVFNGEKELGRFAGYSNSEMFINNVNKVEK